MYHWLKIASLTTHETSALRGALGTGGAEVSESARSVVKHAFNELAQMTAAQLPYMIPGPIQDEQTQRGLPLPAVAALGLGLTGMHLAGDAPTMGNSLRRTINSTLGTDLDTQSRGAAVLKALR
jgi:hypothetical protein